MHQPAVVSGHAAFGVLLLLARAFPAVGDGFNRTRLPLTEVQLQQYREAQVKAALSR